MMNFCHKNVHSFLGFPNTSRDNINGTVVVDVDDDIDSLIFQRHQNSSPVLFSSPFSTSTSDTMIKRDPGGIGFIDDVGGIVDGLMSCTESLGFESSDERRVDDDQIIESMCNSSKESSVVGAGGGSKWKREHVKRQREVINKFPPPLSSLDQNGKPTFFLRPVRKDGKLELREVKISRPEILRASRQDGRLRLHLVCNEDEDDFEEQYKEEEEEEEEEIMQEIDEDDVQENIERKMEQAIMEEGCTDDQEVEEKEEERNEGWQIPVSPGGGEAFRRCHEQVSHHQNHHHQHGHHHHHHDLHVWRQHCVTIS